MATYEEALTCLGHVLRDMRREVRAVNAYKQHVKVSLVSLLLLLNLALASAQYGGPSYNTAPVYRHCTHSSQCDRDLGETCNYLYDGCTVGQCMCDPTYQRKDRSGRCQTARNGGEGCNASDVCPEGMTCTNGVCACYMGAMTEDGYFCLGPKQKLLAQRCYMASDKCLHKASYGYTLNEVLCSRTGFCSCAAGYKAVGYSCMKLGIGEYGCEENFHCEGGAVCLDGRCRCPPGRQPTADNTKCSKIGAFTELPVGEYCNEIDESRYCGRDLVCHQCGPQAYSKCVRSRLTKLAYQVSGSSRARGSWFLVLATPVVWVTRRLATCTSWTR